MRLIDADELIPLIKMGEMNTSCELGEGRNGGIAFAIERINQMPTIEPKKGKWIEPTPEGCFTHDAKAYSMCSECGKKEFLGWRKNFCPNCGSDMRGEQDE